MTYLIDTDVVIDWLMHRREAVERLSSFGSEAISISVMTYGEVYEGLLFGRQARAYDGFNRFLRIATVLDLTPSIMEEFARIRGGLRRAGQRIADADTLIAATAIHHDLTLVTRNRSHFQRVPGLRLL